jgi:hypothetical protein
MFAFAKMGIDAKTLLKNIFTHEWDEYMIKKLLFAQFILFLYILYIF